MDTAYHPAVGARELPPVRPTVGDTSASPVLSLLASRRLEDETERSTGGKFKGSNHNQYPGNSPKGDPRVMNDHLARRPGDSSKLVQNLADEVGYPRLPRVLPRHGLGTTLATHPTGRRRRGRAWRPRWDAHP